MIFINVCYVWSRNVSLLLATTRTIRHLRKHVIPARVPACIVRIKSSGSYYTYTRTPGIIL